MIVSTFFQQYEDYLRQHALSAVTIRNYLADLRAFARWHAERNPRTARVASADFSAYRKHLCIDSKNALRTATVNRHLQSLRLFGRFLHESGHASENPARKIELLRNGHSNGSAPRTLSKLEIDRLFNAIRAGRPSLRSRDYAIMQMMLQAGLRVHEVAALRMSEVRWSKSGITVTANASGGGMRMIPLSTDAARALRSYLEVRTLAAGVDHFFLSQRGQPLSVRSVQRLIDMYAQAAGLDDVSANTLRHTCAKAMLSNGRDAKYVAKLLGHQDVKGLAKYTSKQVNG